MEALQAIATSINYWVVIVLMMIGLYAMISKNNLVKKLIGMSIFQTAILLFYISLAVKEGATIPILHHDQTHGVQEAHGEGIGHADPGHSSQEADYPEEQDHGEHAVAHASLEINPDRFTNPLPHVLMLTAIVVGVSTLGVALSITQKLYTEFGTIEENEILDQIKSDND